jgi:DNA modification methylase
MNYYQDYFKQYFRLHSEIIWAKTVPNLVISWKKPMPQHEDAWLLVRHKDSLGNLNLRRTAQTKPVGYSLGPTHGGARQPSDGSYARTRQKFKSLKFPNETVGVRSRRLSPNERRKQVKVANLDLPLRKGGTGHYLSTVISTPVIRGGHPEYLGHPTQKAVDIIKPLISLTTKPNDHILDPMCGSGTTILASEMLGRNRTGIEINPKFVKLARERVNAYNGHS